jgi:hypothetical protein
VKSQSQLFASLTLVLAAIGTVSAQAQQGAPTWGGLRFGMTEIQVRSVLGTKMLKPEPGPENQPLDTSSYDAGRVVELSVKGFEGHASLIFDKGSKRLSIVTLWLTPKKDLSNQDKVLAYWRLCDDLVKKYGSPVSTREFTTIFRSDGQSIDVLASLNEGVPNLVYIAYEPTNADKGI